jgi:hypothetical protein
MPNNTRSQGGGGGMSDIAAKAEWIVDRVLEKYRTPYIAVDWYKIACAEVAKALQAERDEQKSRAEKMIVYGNSLIEKHDLRASLEKTIGYAEEYLHIKDAWMDFTPTIRADIAEARAILEKTKEEKI